MFKYIRFSDLESWKCLSKNIYNRTKKHSLSSSKKILILNENLEKKLMFNPLDCTCKEGLQVSYTLVNGPHYRKLSKNQGEL
jgi:hypothetical protein